MWSVQKHIKHLGDPANLSASGVMDLKSWTKSSTASVVWGETVVIRDAAFGHFWPFGLTTEGETGHVESYYKLLNCRPPVIYHLHHHVYAFWCFDGLTMLKTTTTDASLSLFKSNMQCCQYRMRCHFWLLIPNSKGTVTHHRQRLRERSYCTLFKNHEQNKILVIGPFTLPPGEKNDRGSKLGSDQAVSSWLANE